METVNSWDVSRHSEMDKWKIVISYFAYRAKHCFAEFIYETDEGRGFVTDQRLLGVVETPFDQLSSPK